MDSSLTSVISSLLPKIEELGRRRDALAAECSLLEARNYELNRSLETAQKEIERLNTECEYLRVSHKLADSDESLIEARRHITRLIKRIDTSIRMLKEDAAL